MKKIFFCMFFSMLPSFVSALSVGQKDAEISRLMAEKQRKYAELEKCVKSVNGLKIAGISTIGLTAGGVALNISQAKQSKSLDKQIDTTNQKIEQKKQEIEEKRIKEEQERLKREKQAQAKAMCEADKTKVYNNGNCVDKTVAEEQQINSVAQNKSKVESDNTIDINQEIEEQENCEKITSMKPGTECYQDETGKWKIRWTVKDGDSCSISECFDKTNTATCKYVWVPSSFECVADTCKTGYKVFGHMCQKEIPIQCDETKGEIVSVSGDICIKCTQGYIASNGKCEKCPHDKKPDGNKCIDYTCGPSEFKTWGDCTKCQKNYIVENNHCVACPDTKKAENNSCIDFSCPSNMYKSFGECVACNTVFENMVPNADQSGCEPNKILSVLEIFEQACAEVGGNLENQTKCVLTDNVFENRNEKCRIIEEKVKLPVFIGSDDAGITSYCSV